MDEVIEIEIPKVDGIETTNSTVVANDEYTTVTQIPEPPVYTLTTQQILLDIGLDFITAVFTIVMSVLMYKIKKSLKEDEMLSTPISKMISRLGPLFVKIFTNVYRVVIKVKTGKNVKGTGIGEIVTDAVKETMELNYKVEPNDKDNPEVKNIPYDEYDIRIDYTDTDIDKIEYIEHTGSMPKVE